jgi:hypothetical protein
MLSIEGLPNRTEDNIMETEVRLPPTIPLLTFARLVLGMGEVAAYSAAAENKIAGVVRIGKFIRVAPRVALAKMAGGDPEVLRLMTADFAAELKQLDEQAA